MEGRRERRKRNGGEEGKEEGEEEKVYALWYAGLEPFIQWDSPSLIQSDTNILREENTQEFVS